MNSRIRALVGLALLGTALVPAGAQAQDNSEARLRRIESELRAVQRAVFPGGDGRYFTPEVDTSAPPQGTPAPVAAPSGGAVTDILARLDAVESQMARVTARSEELSYQLTQMEERLGQLETTGATAAPIGAAPVGVVPAPTTSAGSPAASTPTSGTTTPSAPAAQTRSAAPSPERVAAVQAVAKPQTDDAGDDEYSYGFRLWQAGFFPEAQQQLALFLQRYPSHARTSWGRNLLGRAYLDNGQPREAATHFFENYQSNKQADRAPDSLLYLAESMIAINDTNRACIALAQFGDEYPAVATGRLREQYERNRSRVRCSN
ncbi:tetratricopeptide repeat protein [Croceibacterium sp. TMG7-5b_MA50]|uniref:tetratricopeptide repeat protein n=1 Tax=Croceibacterium sp. TMG7-5b_MA50 TaxID=3121290 RepID=UPI0032217AD0